MPLSKTERRKLVETMGEKNVKRLEAELAKEQANGNGSGGGRGGRVVVYEGEQAESFLERLFGKSDEAEADDDTAGDDGEDEEGDEDEEDEQPKVSNRWFR